MRLRIALIVALLASLAAIPITHFALRPKIQRLAAERHRTANERDVQARRVGELGRQFAEASRNLVRAEEELQTTSDQLAVARAEGDILGDKNNHLVRSLAETASELNAAHQELAQFRLPGVTPDQLATLVRTNRFLTAMVASLEAEKQKLVRDYKKLKSIWDDPLASDEVPQLPPVSGKILVVDPKWQFVVLDLGVNHGLRPRGVLFISRDGKRIGKARLVQVEENRSIANILPDSDLADVREGDYVVN
jgi:hypothetical protein